MGRHLTTGLLGATALASYLVVIPQAVAQTATDVPAGAEPVLEEIVITGSRIPRADLTSTSPISATAREQIKLDRALTVEDFSVKLPQLAGGVNA
ncbi:MAG: hypothetical protein RLY86_4055, partial [Pseudomonadota bacterium]